MKIWAIPGFLGLAKDWQNLLLATSINPFSDFWTAGLQSSSTKSTMQSWGDHFNAWVSVQSTENNIIVGYSMGGRLALHALNQQPKLWSGAVIISTHTGLKTEEEKTNRRKHDTIWAERFLHEPWDEVMAAWNSQDAFKSDEHHFQRFEKDYARPHLAQYLIDASLGAQEELSQNLAALDIPILWMTGENDLAYCQRAEHLCFKHSGSRKVIIPKAGHRAPWNHPSYFQTTVNQFVESIKNAQIKRHPV